MNFLKACFRFYINASIHVATAVTALTALTSIQFHLTLNYRLLTFVFLSSLTGYNFVKYAPVAKLYHKRLTDKLKQIQLFSLLVFLALILCAFYIDREIIITSSVLGLITIFYAIPIGRKNLREIAFLKVFVIAFIWAATSFLLPFIEINYDFRAATTRWYFNFFERFLWVFLLMIPFEIRDLKFDKLYLTTLVGKLGVQPTKITAVTLLVVLCLVKYFYLDVVKFGLYLCIYMSLSYAILNSYEDQKPYYASFWVEALPIFWLSLFVVFNLFQDMP